MEWLLRHPGRGDAKQASFCLCPQTCPQVSLKRQVKDLGNSFQSLALCPGQLRASVGLSGRSLLGGRRPLLPVLFASTTGPSRRLCREHCRTPGLWDKRPGPRPGPGTDRSLLAVSAAPSKPATAALPRRVRHHPRLEKTEAAPKCSPVKHRAGLPLRPAPQHRCETQRGGQGCHLPPRDRGLALLRDRETKGQGEQEAQRPPTLPGGDPCNLQSKELVLLVASL